MGQIKIVLTEEQTGIPGGISIGTGRFNKESALAVAVAQIAQAAKAANLPAPQIDESMIKAAIAEQNPGSAANIQESFDQFEEALDAGIDPSVWNSTTNTTGLLEKVQAGETVSAALIAEVDQEALQVRESQALSGRKGKARGADALVKDFLPKLGARNLGTGITGDTRIGDLSEEQIESVRRFGRPFLGESLWQALQDEQARRGTGLFTGLDPDPSLGMTSESTVGMTSESAGALFAGTGADRGIAVAQGGKWGYLKNGFFTPDITADPDYVQGQDIEHTSTDTNKEIWDLLEQEILDQAQAGTLSYDSLFSLAQGYLDDTGQGKTKNIGSVINNMIQDFYPGNVYRNEDGRVVISPRMSEEQMGKLGYSLIESADLSRLEGNPRLSGLFDAFNTMGQFSVTDDPFKSEWETDFDSGIPGTEESGAEILGGKGGVPGFLDALDPLQAETFGQAWEREGAISSLDPLTLRAREMYKPIAQLQLMLQPEAQGFGDPTANIRQFVRGGEFLQGADLTKRINRLSSLLSQSPEEQVAAWLDPISEDPLLGGGPISQATSLSDLSPGAANAWEDMMLREEFRSLREKDPASLSRLAMMPAMMGSAPQTWSTLASGGRRLANIMLGLDPTADILGKFGYGSR